MKRQMLGEMEKQREGIAQLREDVARKERDAERREEHLMLSRMSQQVDSARPRTFLEPSSKLP